MATLVDYEVTAPDGTELIVTGPEGATQEQIIKAAQEQYKSGVNQKDNQILTQILLLLLLKKIIPM